MNEWINDLDQDALALLIPARAATATEDRAAALTANDLAKKGLIKTRTIPVSYPKKASKKKFGSAATKPTKKKATKQNAIAKPKTKTIPIYENFWTAIKKEIRILICTDDKKYDDLRQEVGKQGKGSSLIVCTIIASTIGPPLGIDNAICITFVGLALKFVLQVGTNAFCEATL